MIKKNKVQSGFFNHLKSNVKLINDDKYKREGEVDAPQKKDTADTKTLDSFIKEMQTALEQKQGVKTPGQMPFSMADTKEYSKLHEESEVLNSPLGQSLASSNSAFDVAALAGKLAQSYFGFFALTLHQVFGKDVNMKLSYKQ